MLIKLAIAVVAAAAITGGVDAPVVQDAGTLREWGTRLVEFGPIAVFLAFVISGIGLHLSEDFILVPAGIFAYQQWAETGSWNWFIQAAFAAWLGIVIGDA